MKRQPSISESEPRADTAGQPGWWMKVAQVRLRFLFIILTAGIVASQWQFLRNVWDRWAWSISRKQPLGAVSDNREYFCPMDPGVHSFWPAICPICNMDLVPRNKMDAVLLPEGVVARMQLAPYRIQLAGIKTTEVKLRSLVYELNVTGILKRAADGSVGLDASISTTECSLFPNELPTEIKANDEPECVPAKARLQEGSFPPRIRIDLDDSNSLMVGSIVAACIKVPICNGEDVLAAPVSAVVDRGRERLVYVETMPGMFDAVMVELGRRCGEFYPVVKGLKPGQRIALAGAFLIDAETRLNPSMAAGYFGASPNEAKPSSPSPAAVPATSAPVTTPSAKSGPPKKKGPPLSADDQKMADKQRICPVTELPLDSMGGPVPVMVSGRKVFICCAGCEKRLKEDPEKYLSRLGSD